MQAPLVSIPEPVEYVPAAQAVHAERPAVPEYVPATQAVHTETPAIPEYVPTGHAWHTALAVTVQVVDVNWPAGQTVQPMQALALDTVE